MIADFKPPLLIAEISANHDKSLEQLLDLIDISYSAGWNCVKLQTYTAESLTLKSSHPSLKIDKMWGEANLYDLYKRAAMPMEFHEPAFKKIKDYKMKTLSSVYDPRDIDFLEKLGCEAYKIASFELNYHDLLLELAQTGKEIIVSTGMASIEEVRKSIEVLRKNTSDSKISVLHCCSAYPAPLNEVNLRAIITLKQEFNLSIGFSDHTIGHEAAVLAYSFGAQIIEKHVTNDTKRLGPDHRFSAEKDVLIAIKEGIKKVMEMSGTGIKQTTISEQINREKGRRSAFATLDIKKGEYLSNQNFRFVRPGVGIPPDQGPILGLKVNKDIPYGHPILWEDLIVK